MLIYVLLFSSNTQLGRDLPERTSEGGQMQYLTSVGCDDVDVSRYVSRE